MCGCHEYIQREGPGLGRYKVTCCPIAGIPEDRHNLLLTIASNVTYPPYHMNSHTHIHNIACVLCPVWDNCMYVQICTLACMYRCTFACIYMYMYKHIHLCAHAHVNVDVCIHVSSFVHVCVKCMLQKCMHVHVVCMHLLLLHWRTHVRVCGEIQYY